MSPKTGTEQAWALASIALHDALTDFILSRQAMLCSTGTMRWYGYTAGRFLQWLEGQGITQPEEVTARLVRAYLAELSPGLADTTLHGHARAIRTLVRFWHEEGYLSQPVKFAMPKLAEKRLPVLDASQLEKVIKACQNTRDKALVLLLADTGLRRAEIVALNWLDIDIPSGLVRVVKGKGGKARSVIAGATTRRALLAYRRTLDRRGDSDPLFQTDEGTRLTIGGLRSALVRIGKRAGIHVSPHMLRRTFATLSRRAGMDVIMLQALLGHSSLGMTEHYIRWIDDDLQEAHAKHGAIDNLSMLK